MAIKLHEDANTTHIRLANELRKMIAAVRKGRDTGLYFSVTLPDHVAERIADALDSTPGVPPSLDDAATLLKQQPDFPKILADEMARVVAAEQEEHLTPATLRILSATPRREWPPALNEHLAYCPRCAGEWSSLTQQSPYAARVKAAFEQLDDELNGRRATPKETPIEMPPVPPVSGPDCYIVLDANGHTSGCVPHVTLGGALADAAEEERERPHAGKPQILYCYTALPTERG